LPFRTDRPPAGNDPGRTGLSGGDFSRGGWTGGTVGPFFWVSTGRVGGTIGNVSRKPGGNAGGSAVVSFHGLRGRADGSAGAASRCARLCRGKLRCLFRAAGRLGGSISPSFDLHPWSDETGRSPPAGCPRRRRRGHPLFR